MCQRPRRNCGIKIQWPDIFRFLLKQTRLKDHYYRNSASIDITPPTAYTPQLVEIAKRLLAKIYKEGYRYKSCGVMLTNFSDEKFGPAGSVYPCLFGQSQTAVNEGHGWV